MENLYIAVGCNGVGKTTVITEATKNTGIQIVSFGELITGLMIRDGIATTRDELRKKADQKTWILYQRLTAEEIGKMPGKIIVDTHASVPSPHGYYPGLPPNVLNNFPMPPSVIFLIEAHPEEIYSRRQNDSERVRDFDFENSLYLIKQHQEINRSFAASYCASTGARLKIVQNNDDNLERAIKEVKDTLLEV